MMKNRLGLAMEREVKAVKTAPLYTSREAGIVALETTAETIAQLENRILDLEAAQGIGEGARNDG